MYTQQHNVTCKYCAVYCIQALHTICCIQAVCNTSHKDTYFILFYKFAQSTQTTHWAITPCLQQKGGAVGGAVGEAVGGAVGGVASSLAR